MGDKCNIEFMNMGRYKLDLNSVRRTNDGAILLSANVVRSGVMEFMGYELGDTDNPMKVYKCNTAAEDLERLKPQFKGLSVTNGHCFITDLGGRNGASVGTVLSDGVDNGEFLKVELCITDGATIASIEAGRLTELSIGGYSNFVEASDEDEWDYDIKNTRLDHLAVVEYARAGRGARFLNHAKNLTTGGGAMTEEVVANATHDAKDELAHKLAKLSAENDALKLQLRNERGQDTAMVKAIQIANEHQCLINSMRDLGLQFDKSIGCYDRVVEMQAAVKVAVGIDLSGRDEVYTTAYYNAVVDARKATPITNGYIGSGASKPYDPADDEEL